MALSAVASLGLCFHVMCVLDDNTVAPADSDTNALMHYRCSMSECTLLY